MAFSRGTIFGIVHPRSSWSLQEILWFAQQNADFPIPQNGEKHRRILWRSFRVAVKGPLEICLSPPLLLDVPPFGITLTLRRINAYPVLNCFQINCQNFRLTKLFELIAKNLDLHLHLQLFSNYECNRGAPRGRDSTDSSSEKTPFVKTPFPDPSTPSLGWWGGAAVDA